ncbi:MAG TPA: GIY-YIG nuclease family protein, partial [Chitinophagaceae bacterium]
MRGWQTRRSNLFIRIIIILTNMERGGTVYILTNRTHTVLYVGVTSDLISRMQQHLSKTYKGSFTDRYNVD